ncbi:PAS domain S-box-containing protein [Syntrophus gentianae]|uniref:histidine kinase n=1 Tax=Syntrophus gentianae TaxID=43775 RepID=A0A1H7WHN1_9BACT|nr:PAS domain S-box protein [Syntrophus gentianae]SEM20407.1 PAS domain S-box-containing protein [Syntrophus gentianae]
MATRKTMTREQFMAELEFMKKQTTEPDTLLGGKIVEDILQEKEKYRLILENLSDAVFLLKIPEGAYEYVSPAVAEVFGYPAEDFYRKPFFIRDIIHPDYFEYCNENWEDLLGGTVAGRYEYKIIDSKGKERWIDQSNRGLFDSNSRLIALIGLCRNVATSRQAATVKENEQRYRRLFESAGDPVFLVDRKTEFIVDANMAALGLYGYSSAEILKLKITDISTEPDKTALALKAAKTNVRKWYHKKQDGAVFPVEATVSCFTQKQRKLVEVVVRDIADRIRTEEGLLESEARYRCLFEENIGVMLLVNPDTGKIVDANSAACQFYGYSKDVLKAKMIDDINILSREQLLRDMERARKRECGHFYFLNRLSNGEVRDVEAYIGPIEISGEQLLYFLVHDITDRKHMEEELVKARQLESVGILTGGIAHDFNNLLAALLGNVSLAKLSLSSDNPAYEKMIQAEKICLQGRELTNRLATFAQGGGPLRKKVMIAAFLRDTVALFLSGSNVRCEFEFPDSLWPLEIDVGQVQKVIRHLIMNAQEAMPEGGAIRIRAENVNVTSGEVPSLKEGSYIRISFQDQGVGIPPEYQGKVFDPYFTTKPVENVKGAGLGLAICYSIIKKHEGYLALSSKVGIGTTFTIYLPASSYTPASVSL